MKYALKMPIYILYTQLQLKFSSCNIFFKSYRVEIFLYRHQVAACLPDRAGASRWQTPSERASHMSDAAAAPFQLLWLGPSLVS